MWCDLSGSVELAHVTFSVFYLIEVFTWRGTFCWKPHLNRSSGSKVISNWRVLRTIENNRNTFLFLAISHCCRLPTDPARSQHIFPRSITWKAFMIYNFSWKTQYFLICFPPQIYRKIVMDGFTEKSSWMDKQCDLDGHDRVVESWRWCTKKSLIFTKCRVASVSFGKQVHNCEPWKK